MSIISLPQAIERKKQVSDVERYIGESEAKFNLILSEIMKDDGREAHEAESLIFRRLPELGLVLLKLFFANRGGGDYGETLETGAGKAERGRKSERTYFSIFGKIRISRYLYRTADGKTFAPSDIFLNLPKRCYSYFLSEMLGLLNIKEAYSEGAGFMKRFFGLRISVSASETISNGISSRCEEFYGSESVPEKKSGEKDLTAVSFDGKGVPMIKKEAAKIRGRRGKGEKRQKKKESLVGVRYDIDRNARTAGDVAENLVYPEKRAEKEKEKQNRACNTRYVASVAKPKKEVMEEIHEEVKDGDFSGTPLICLMDGAPHLRKYLKEVFGDIPNKVCIPDIIHVLEYIWIIAHIPHGEGSGEAKKYVYEKLMLVLEGKIASYIMELQAEMRSGRWKKKSHQEKFHKVITYFRNHRQYMKYDEYLSEGYPIGTGVVESACGHVVKDRMEISGARWSIEGAESILRSRSVFKSGDWDAYWKFFVGREKENIFFPDDYNHFNIKEKQCA